MGITVNGILFYGIVFERDFNGEDTEEVLAKSFGFNEEAPDYYKEWGEMNDIEKEEWRKEYRQWHKRKEEAILNLEIGYFGWGDEPYYFLTAKETHKWASYGDTVAIDLKELASLNTSDVDDRIKKACEMLGVEYQQPQWHLTNYYS